MKKKVYIISLLIIGILLILRDYLDILFIEKNRNINDLVFINEYYNSIENDYHELLSKIGMDSYTDLNVIMSKIKYRNIYDFNNTITIYKGYKEGIKKNDLVLDEVGLIGVVKNTFSHTSIVELITSPNSHISVRVNNTFGILKNVSNKLYITNMSNYDTVSVGDPIYTSGIGNLKGNIYIGKVMEIEISNNELEKYALVDYASNINNINYVYIIGS